MNQISFVPQVPPPLPPAPVSFSGDRGDFRSMVTKGAALELITFGFYRFWLTTDIRRHVWANTSIDGDAAEYTGRGRELFIGFLVALAVLLPIYLAYFLIGIEAERLKSLLSLPLFLAFYAFGQFAIYRARRYRLTRTVWRGTRFWMDGSGWAFAGRAMLWGLLVVLTLGLALPWRAAALEGYKMRHSHYGDLQGSFRGRGWEFFKNAWWLWLLSPFAFMVFPALPFLYAEFKAREWRWWLSGIRFGGVRVESKLPSTAFYGVYWKVIGWSLLFLVAYVAYLLASIALVSNITGLPVAQLVGPHSQTRVPLLVLLGVGYLVFALAISTVMRVYLQRDLWTVVLASVNVHGIEAAANVRARGELANAIGEGFADGLDVAGF